MVLSFSMIYLYFLALFSIYNLLPLSGVIIFGNLLFSSGIIEINDLFNDSGVIGGNDSLL